MDILLLLIVLLAAQLVIGALPSSVRLSSAGSAILVGIVVAIITVAVISVALVILLLLLMSLPLAVAAPAVVSAATTAITLGRRVLRVARIWAARRERIVLVFVNCMLK